MPASIHRNLQEVLAWNDQDFKKDILELLPVGWGFSFGLDQEARVYRYTFKEGEAVRKEGEALGVNALLRDAWAWLYFRGYQSTQDPRWRVPAGHIHHPVTLEAVADPLDLDPDEIRRQIEEM
jgi:hypothetical protein